MYFRDSFLIRKTLNVQRQWTMSICFERFSWNEVRTRKGSLLQSTHFVCSCVFWVTRKFIANPMDSSNYVYCTFLNSPSEFDCEFPNGKHYFGHSLVHKKKYNNKIQFPDKLKIQYQLQLIPNCKVADFFRVNTTYMYINANPSFQNYDDFLDMLYVIENPCHLSNEGNLIQDSEHRIS